MENGSLVELPYPNICPSISQCTWPNEAAAQLCRREFTKKTNQLTTTCGVVELASYLVIVGRNGRLNFGLAKRWRKS